MTTPHSACLHGFGGGSCQPSGGKDQRPPCTRKISHELTPHPCRLPPCRVPTRPAGRGREPDTGGCEHAVGRGDGRPDRPDKPPGDLTGGAQASLTSLTAQQVAGNPLAGRPWGVYK